MLIIVAQNHTFNRCSLILQGHCVAVRGAGSVTAKGARPDSGRGFVLVIEIGCVEFVAARSSFLIPEDWYLPRDPQASRSISVSNFWLAMGSGASAPVEKPSRDGLTEEDLTEDEKAHLQQILWTTKEATRNGARPRVNSLGSDAPDQ